PQAPPKHPSSTPQVELLKQKMGNAYMTMKEIAELCGIKDLKYFRKSYIIPALEIGVIERLYPNHPKHPKQQYRLRIDK
ncbi:MAG: ATP-dependent DNA helicase RecG, partial [Prevotella sp.]|nr:ATP-dependent DNA helicase RecG [Prevotella sp.]